MCDSSCSVNALPSVTVVLEGLPCFANTNALREGIQTMYRSIKVFVIYIISLLTSQIGHSEELSFEQYG